MLRISLIFLVVGDLKVVSGNNCTEMLWSIVKKEYIANILWLSAYSTTSC